MPPTLQSVLRCGTVVLFTTACTVESSQQSDPTVVSEANSALQGGNGRNAPPVVFDSDMDFDDTAALAYLAGEHKLGRIELRAVTVTNNGGGLPVQGLLHARCLLARFGLEDVPVADGAPTGPNAFPDFVRNLIDLIISSALSDCVLSPEPSSQGAAQLLASEITETDRPLTLLSTGPLTNVAEALAALPKQSLERGLAGVITMGGAVHVPGELLAPDPRFDGTQTVNYWVDPHAAHTVLQLTPDGRLTMVPHDATNFVPITIDFLDRLTAEATAPEAGYVSALMSHPIVRGGIQAGRSAFWWDPLAAVALDEQSGKIIDYDWERIDIVEEGPSAGRTLAVAPNEPGTWLKLAVSADQAAFETRFLNTLNGVAR
jgi:inosine-uridine nucleoside N-ribohydrolase